MVKRPKMEGGCTEKNESGQGSGPSAETYSPFQIKGKVVIHLHSLSCVVHGVERWLLAPNPRSVKSRWSPTGTYSTHRRKVYPVCCFGRL